MIDVALANGFVSFSTSDWPHLRMQLTRTIGAITTTDLSVKEVDHARPNTLSARHGAGHFPHHTDFAFRPVPPQIVALVNESDQEFERPTYVTRLSSVTSDLVASLDRSAWSLRVRGKTFVVFGGLTVGKHTARRWDTEFLEPREANAFRCSRELPAILQANQDRYDWGPRTGLLIDNWSCTHARGIADNDTGRRQLTRYEIWHHAGMA